MNFAYFRIPIADGTAELAELNRFLTTHRTVNVEQHFVQAGRDSCWAVSVSYEAGTQAARSATEKQKIDYKTLLSAADFAVYAALREIRAKQAETAGIPVYAVLNNAHLAEIATGKVTTLTELGSLSGVGSAKVEQFGLVFLAAAQQLRAAP